MSSILTNLSVIQKLAKDLVQARHLSYSEQCIPYYIDETKFSIEHIEDLRNPSGYLLKSSLIRHRFPTTQQLPNMQSKQEQQKQYKPSNTKCVVFLHGLGSSRLEALPLVNSLPVEYCLFAFDFAGSGKSQGQDITYGLRESEDICSILDYLRINKGIRQFIIWGRSMGAVACLLYSINLAEMSKNCISAKSQLQRIKGLVIDSPFSDFREVTKHIGLKRVNLPEFLMDFALSIIENTFNQLLIDPKRNNKTYNPFQIKLGMDPIETKIPTIFLYSQIDEVVPKEHSQRIIKVYRSLFDKFVLGDCSHNQSRPKQIIDKVFNSLRKFQSRLSHPRAMSIHRESQGLTRNNSFDGDRNSRVGRRGISVQSKEREKSFMVMQNNQTEQSIENQRSQKTCLTSYNSLKIEPRRNEKISCKKMSRNVYMNDTPQQKIPTSQHSPLKIRLSNSQNRTQTSKISISVHKRTENSQIYQHSKVNTVFYNSIQYDNSILQKKLLRNNHAGNVSEEGTLYKTLEGRNSMKYRRGSQMNRKVEYQLSHTRYL